tara:strand:+ start:230 stop:487 length:258 start_codon:yes stop_codon:yes gene_type:complete
MYNKIKNIFFFLILILFLFIVTFYYFSEENKKKINTNRVKFSENLENKANSIPTLKNDTENVIDYTYSDIENKKIKKRHFWKLLN